MTQRTMGAGPGIAVSVPTGQADFMQDTQIQKSLQEWFTMAHRVRCRRVQKDCLCTGDPKDPAESLELTAAAHSSPY